MLAGYLGARFQLVSQSFLREANKFVFKFSLPLLLYKNVAASVHSGDFNGKLILTCLITIISMIALSCILVPLFVKRRGQQGSIIQAIYRSNFVIYGIPLAMSIYGESALTTIAMLMAVSIPFYNMSAVLILAYFSETRTGSIFKWKTLVEVVTNPLLLGAVVGYIFGMLKITLPEWLDFPVRSVANIATPLALIVMGGQFEMKNMKKNLNKVLITSALRLIIVPAIALTVFIAMGFTGVELVALLCLFATPTAVTSYIMAENMGNDGELAGQVVVLTTLASCFTIFGFVFVMKTLGVI
ncbi:transporter [Bacteroidia bacterium]|nr:transporter [Bacteroidia bacterium]